ncbi:MAG: DUF6446 family protein [Pseudomonadota bacterium]
MSGRILMIGLIVTALSIGAGIWYSAQVGSYETISGIDEVQVGETDWGVANYRGLDGDSSPLKLRGCFDFELPYTSDPKPQSEATPLVAPHWFDCFDAAKIQNDIRAGVANVLISSENEPFGFTTYIAHYPNGEAFIWRQINKCGEAQFEGNDLPQGCPGAAVPGSAVMAQSVMGSFEGLQPVAGTVRGSGRFACFETALSEALITETFVILDPSPNGPKDAPACFPESLTADIMSGRALALIGKDESQIIALYPDGRGYVWVAE